ncbi:MAG: VIT1/CCC1 transporter family protein [Burkholderiaceae bacterium]|nr:VIT1/CCC1 transporter family protein [Burkholderiaceae bacterium]
MQRAAIRANPMSANPNRFPGHEVDSAREGYLEEARSSRLYVELAAIETDARIARMYTDLSRVAAQQAGLWADKLRAAGQAIPTEAPLGFRASTALALARRIGIRPMRGVFAALKVRGLSVYSAAPMPGHPSVTRVEQIGRRHRTGGGNLRAAVFGVNDGLVSNASLIMGMAGAAAEPRTLLLTGVAGLLAGAFSMAAGEYVSVRSQREVFEYQIGLEREELDEYPQAEADELALIYETKGMERDDARRLAQALIADPERALDTLAREELGLNPDELGSPWGAATSSFLAFAAGAVVPLLPYVLGEGERAFAASIALAAAALFGVGATLSFFTGRGALASGLRMLAIGAAAGAATYGIGSLIGVSVA